MSPTDLVWFQSVSDGATWVKMVQNGSNFNQMVPNDPKCSQMVWKSSKYFKGLNEHRYMLFLLYFNMSFCTFLLHAFMKIKSPPKGLQKNVTYLAPLWMSIIIKTRPLSQSKTLLGDSHKLCQESKSSHSSRGSHKVKRSHRKYELQEQKQPQED